jgi:hypothetical protein
MNKCLTNLKSLKKLVAFLIFMPFSTLSHGAAVSLDSLSLTYDTGVNITYDFDSTFYNTGSYEVTLADVTGISLTGTIDTISLNVSSFSLYIDVDENAVNPFSISSFPSYAEGTLYDGVGLAAGFNGLPVFSDILTYNIGPGFEFGSLLSAPNFGYTSAVPVPAAVWLFGSGLIGLVGLARRKKA